MLTGSAAIRRSGRVAAPLAAAAIVLAGAIAVPAIGRNEASSGPAFAPVPLARPPEERAIGGVRHIVSLDAPARLLLDSVPPTGDARLLWYQGRATQALGDGAVVVDSAGTLLTFSPRLTPRRPPAQLGARHLVAAAAGTEGTLWVAAADGTVLRLDERGEPLVETFTPFAAPGLATDPAGDGVWVVRSTARFEFRLDTAEAPLAARLDGSGKLAGELGNAGLPEHVLLRDLANAGHLAVAPERVFFAPFIRDEIVAFSRGGDTLWIASRGLPQSTVEPRFEVNDGRPVINYHPVNLGLAIGADGNVYALSTPGFTTAASRLDVFDPATGRLLRSAQLATALPTLAGDSKGRVYRLDPERLLSGTAPADRPLAPDVTWPLRGGGRISLGGLRGRVVLINFWASWCLPCREEMPALDSLQRRLTDHAFVFLPVNEDHNVDDAGRFLDEFGFDFPVPLGRGRMRERFHYPGLPYTILLDREGRVARKWIGYAGPDQIRLIETVVRAELASGVGRAEPGHHDHH